MCVPHGGRGRIDHTAIRIEYFDVVGPRLFIHGNRHEAKRAASLGKKADGVSGHPRISRAGGRSDADCLALANGGGSEFHRSRTGHRRDTADQAARAHLNSMPGCRSIVVHGIDHDASLPSREHTHIAFPPDRLPSNADPSRRREPGHKFRQRTFIFSDAHKSAQWMHLTGAGRSPLQMLPTKLAMIQLYARGALTHAAEIDADGSGSVERRQVADPVAQSSEKNREFRMFADRSEEHTSELQS